MSWKSKFYAYEDDQLVSCETDKVGNIVLNGDCYLGGSNTALVLAVELHLRKETAHR